MKEKERLMAELLVAKGKLTKAQRYQRELEERNDAADRKIAECTTQLEVTMLGWFQLSRVLKTFYSSCMIY